MNIKIRTSSQGENNSNTKKQLDNHFAHKLLTVLADADLLLLYISKKIDLEIKLKRGVGRQGHIRAIGRGRAGGKNVLIIANQGINKLAYSIVENSSNGIVDIESVRLGLNKLCPLWPIC